MEVPKFSKDFSRIPCNTGYSIELENFLGITPDKIRKKEISRFDNYQQLYDGIRKHVDNYLVAHTDRTVSSVWTERVLMVDNEENTYTGIGLFITGTSSFGMAKIDSPNRVVYPFQIVRLPISISETVLPYSFIDKPFYTRSTRPYKYSQLKHEILESSFKLLNQGIAAGEQVIYPK